MRAAIPLRLILREDLALGVVADDLDVDEAAEVELLRTEHGHDCGVGGGEMTVREVSCSSTLSSSSRSCPINFWGSARQASERRQAFLLDNVPRSL